MNMTVADLVKAMEKSNGFVLILGCVGEKNPDNTFKLDFHFMRQQFPLEEMPKAFLEFRNLIATDMSKSGYNLLQDAEQIVTQALTDNPDKPNENTSPSPGSAM